MTSDQPGVQSHKLRVQGSRSLDPAGCLLTESRPVLTSRVGVGVEPAAPCRSVSRTARRVERGARAQRIADARGGQGQSRGAWCGARSAETGHWRSGRRGRRVGRRRALPAPSRPVLGAACGGDPERPAAAAGMERTERSRHAKPRLKSHRHSPGPAL